MKTRSSKKKLVTLHWPTNEKYKKSITYQGPKLWNGLPGQLQKLDSYFDFRREIKKLFQAKTRTQRLNCGKAKSETKPKPKPKSKPHQKCTQAD